MNSKQHGHNGTTVFESIPNEIFIEILSYITSTDAFVAFSNLNSRYQRLLMEICHSFDFTSINKKNFDLIFRYQDIIRWHSLKLADAKYTPGQVAYFFENHTLTGNFSQLRSLSIINMIHNHSYPLFTQLSSLSSLVSLQIESLCGQNIPEFDLPNLKRLSFTSCLNTRWLKNNTELVWPQTLRCLKIIYEDHRNCTHIQQSLTNLPQLNDLEVYQKQPDGPFPSGETWRQIILTSIPSLKNFKFYFQFTCRVHRLNELKQVVESFSTPFYISKNKWFVRCDMSAHDEPSFYDDKYGICNENMRHVILYTIPFTFDEFPIFKIFSKTKISDYSRNSIDYESNNMATDIKTLFLKSNTTPDTMFNRSSIVNLTIITYFDASAWVPIMNKLRQITIGDGAALSVDDFNILLDNTPYLYSLTVKKSVLKQMTDNWTDACICRHLSRKIRVLTFSSDQNLSQSLDKNELEKILPIFSSQCQHLSLGIQSYNNTIDFILQQQNTRFNRGNCIMTNVRHQYHFWLG
ncbi:hypothetical protein I4U23_004706 [Adineta vaga]|nr:hypothetical protein I4U23_004706 [Adineta vaga]